MLLLFAHTISPRLQYIVDFFSKELFEEPIRITTDAKYYRAYQQPRINYSNQEFTDEEFLIRNTPLLFETGIRPQSITCFDINFHKAFFETSGDFPFDIFAASFYLISRYEEYLPHEKDAYGRYAHTNSLAFANSFYQCPSSISGWMNSKERCCKNFPGCHSNSHSLNVY